MKNGYLHYLNNLTLRALFNFREKMITLISNYGFCCGSSEDEADILKKHKQCISFSKFLGCKHANLQTCKTIS